MTYTIKQVMPTGKDDPKFGKEYMVQFEEDSRTVKMSFKKDDPKPGDTEEGEIVDSKYGSYFKRGQSKPAFVPGEKKEWKDNSDGMRQGMCFNNAANYVATFDLPAALTDREWADLVFSYAQALYLKGDLTQTPEGSQVSPEETTGDVNPFDPTNKDK